MSADLGAAASAVCAAKSAGWAALRRLNAGEESRAAAYGQMKEADVAADEFRAQFYPTATLSFGIGDRALGQPFELFVVLDGEPTSVWREQP